MRKPKVTVVIPLYNKERFIEDAIKSVINQTYKYWQLLIIDDHSTDRSLEFVNPYLKDNRIKCISLNNNIGLNNVNNYALSLVETEFFLQLDADDWLFPEAIESLLEAAHSHPTAGLIYGNHIKYLYDEEDNIIEEEEITIGQYEDKYDLLYRMNYAMVPRLFRTKCLRDVGGWLAQKKGDAIAEDVQITLRIASKYDCIWVDKFLYHRRLYKENLENFKKSRPLAREYRYELFNQVLSEWGNERIPIWQSINGSYYLNRLEENQNKVSQSRYTIVIPNFNHRDTLPGALISALEQTLQPEKIIILDDASTDDSIKRLQSTIKSSKIEIIESKENEGISKVLNKALEHINTPYFIQLDGDDWLECHAAEKLITSLERTPHAAYAYGNHRLWEETEDGFLKLYNNIIQPYFSDKYDMLLKLGFMVNPRCYRTEYVKNVGGWLTNDPWDGRYFEDARMILRLASKYSWVHVEDFLHNVRYSKRKSDGKIDYYNYLRTHFYEELLEEWGATYKPVWKTASTGRVILERLEKK